MENEKKKKSIFKKWWFWVIVVVVVVAIASQGNNSTPTSSNSSDNNISQEDVMVVDYKVLYQEYMDNPIAADAKYKGKILQVTGEVGSIDREISQETYITFDIDFLQDIRLTFKKSEEAKVAQLSKGQTVTVKGKCNGTLLSTTVALGDCELVD